MAVVSALMYGGMGTGILFGGYKAAQQQRDICDKTKDTKKAVEEYTTSMNDRIKSLKTENINLIKQIGDNAEQIQSNMYALQQVIQAQGSSYLIVRVVMIVSVVVVAMLFFLKRRKLLSFDFDKMFSRWRESRQTKQPEVKK